MYLTKDDGLAALRRVVGRFPSGELQFDAFSTFGIRTQVINSVVRRSGSTFHWGTNGPSDVIDAVPGTRLLAWQSVFDSDTFDLLSPAARWLGRAMAVIPGGRPWRSTTATHSKAPRPGHRRGIPVDAWC